jgi:dTDP-4-dehydrorhamnose 3,5-epimerase-like enzyme
MNLNQCALFKLPCIHDPRGNLTFVESHRHIPFEIRRVYYLHDIPKGAERGGHAHRNLHQLVIATSGSFDIHLDDGETKKTWRLNRSHLGLYIRPMVWREIDHFSSDAVCMVLASDYYDEDDYYRNYARFLHDVRHFKLSCKSPS